MAVGTFIDADEMSMELGVSKQTAYRLIRNLNSELESKGRLTLQGKVVRQYFEERFFGEGSAS